LTQEELSTKNPIVQLCPHPKHLHLSFGFDYLTPSETKDLSIPIAAISMPHGNGLA
jgi:hypothetical protein